MIETSRRRHLVTHCDYNYLSRALVLIQSVAKNSSDYLVVLVCHDEKSFLIMEERAIQNVKLIKLSEIEGYFEELSNKKLLIEPMEYIFLITPFIIKFCLEAFSLENIAYVDSDICFFNKIDSIFDEVQYSDVGITSHNFPSNLNHLAVNGKFNVGVVFFRNTDNGNRILSWWADRCLESTSIESDSPDVFGDQKYLDLFSRIYPDTHVYKNLGINAAPWNCHDVTLDKNGRVYVKGNELICFHFSGLKASGKKFIAGYHRYNVRPKATIKSSIYLPYVRQLYATNENLNIKGDYLKPRIKIISWIRALLFGDFLFISK